jgi:hypothetical protein
MLPDRSPAASAAAALPSDRFGARFRSGARPRPRGRALDDGPLTVAGAAELSPIPLAPGHSTYTEVAVAARVAPSRPAAVASGPGRRGPARRGPVQRGPGRRRLSRRGIAATAAGGLAAFALGLAAVAAAGGGDDLRPVAPPVTTYTVEHGVTGGAPGPNPEVGAADAAVTRR